MEPTDIYLRVQLPRGCFNVVQRSRNRTRIRTRTEQCQLTSSTTPRHVTVRLDNHGKTSSADYETWQRGPTTAAFRWPTTSMTPTSRYRVRGHCQGTRSGGSEALEVSVAVEATAVWSRLISICEYSYRVTVSTWCNAPGIEPESEPESNNVNGRQVRHYAL